MGCEPLPLGTSNTIFLLESAPVRGAVSSPSSPRELTETVSTTTASSSPLLRFALLCSLSLCLSAASAARSSLASSMPGSPHSAWNSSSNFFLASIANTSLLLSSFFLAFSAATASRSSSASSIPGSTFFSFFTFSGFSALTGALLSRAASSSALLSAFSIALATAASFFLCFSALASASNASDSSLPLSEEASLVSFSTKGRLSGMGSTSLISTS